MVLGIRQSLCSGGQKAVKQLHPARTQHLFPQIFQRFSATTYYSDRSYKGRPGAFREASFFWVMVTDTIPIQEAPVPLSRSNPGPTGGAGISILFPGGQEAPSTKITMLNVVPGVLIEPLGRICHGSGRTPALSSREQQR